MKKMPPRHKAKKNTRGFFSFFLAIAIVITCSAFPVSGAVAPGASSGDEISVSSDISSDIVSDVTSDIPEASPSPELKEETSGQPEVSPSPSPTAPPIKYFTVTFDLGVFGKEKVQVEEGMLPKSIPTVPALEAATFLGWFDESGNSISPDYTPATRDIIYTARFSRNLKDLLNTYEHSPYIGGYANGMFKPQSGITRAEAAKMFYSLLISPERETKTFSDVSADKWYATPVGVMATLGIVSGYSDGKFLPNNKITRAEFVKMAVSFDTAIYGESSFSDVPETFWATQYIVTATEKGWINGFSDGSFHPNEEITRAQAVTIINKMLGRIPDSGIGGISDAKNFYDVFTSHWAYGQIEEAATKHSFSSDGTVETWTDYERDESKVATSCWVSDGSDRYYLDAKTRKFVRGSVTVNGLSYLLDSSTGKAVTGFKNIGSFRRYYKNGIMQDDISGLGVVDGPYLIKVYKSANYLIIFAKDAVGNYNIPVRAMRVSCGKSTPCGTFYTPMRYRWLKMMGDTFAQWCTQIEGNYLFHSVPNWTHNNFDLEVDEYNHLGDTRSMGCIRLNCRDAKWIFDNCVLGTKVFISSWESSGPIAKPNGLQIPAWHTWDPTDPTAYYRCRQNGCH